MTDEEVKAWEKAARKMKEAGLSLEMAEKFLPNYYIPQPKQIEWHRLTELCDSEGVRLIGNGGSRGSGKTTATFAQVALYDCQKYPGIKCLYVRRVMKSAEESFEQMVASLLSEFKDAKINSEKVRFKNGSSITIAGLRDPGDAEKYVGINVDLMVIEEANQLDEQRIEMLLGSLRTGRLDGYKPRCYMNFNPGGPGMAYLKKTFIQPYRAKQEKSTRFIFTKYQENKFLDSGYVDYLDNLGGLLGKLWRDGDFDVQAGMAFDNFNRDIYVYDDWDIGDDWIRMRGIDDGFTKPYCCLWMAKDPVTGRVVVYNEDYGENHTNGEQAERIKTMTPASERISITYADPAMWQKSHHTDSIVKSGADIYADHGIYLSRADNDRKAGLARIRELMRYKPDGMPGLIILSRCKNLIWQFENLPTDPRNPEDVDTDFEDHAYDALRYGTSGTTGSERRVNTERKNLERHPLYYMFRD